MPDAEQAALLREALDALATWPVADDDPSDGLEQRQLLETTLQGELALALLFNGDAEERSALVLDALERVRSVGEPDPLHLARALLNARLGKAGPERLGERLRDLEEIDAQPAHRLTPEVRIAVHAYRHEDELRMGDRVRARRSLDAARRLADRHGHPFWQWATDTWASLSLVIDGRLEEAEAQVMGSIAIGGSPPEASACFGVQLVDIRLFQGRAGEVVPLLADAAEANPHIPCYRAVLALCASESGDLDQAEAGYRAFADTRFTELPDDSNRFLALAVLADVAADLGDGAGAADLTDLLLPYTDQHVVLNCYGGGGAYWGPTARVLGRLALVRGRTDEAARCFAEATAQAASLVAPLAEARVRRDAGERVG